MIIPSARRFPVKDDMWTPWFSPALEKIDGLTVFRGRLYPWYGEWTANNGPYDIVSIGTDESIQVEYSSMSTDHVSYRVIDGRLIALHVDPKGSHPTGEPVLLIQESDGQWRISRDTGSPRALHVFDVKKFKGALFYSGSVTTGSSNSDGIIRKSTDDGQTWESVYRSETKPGMHRIYRMWVHEGGLHFRDPSDSMAKVTYDGGDTWQNSSLDLTNLSETGPEWMVRKGVSRNLVEGSPPMEWSDRIAYPRGLVGPSSQYRNNGHPFAIIGEYAYAISQSAGLPTIMRRRIYR